MTHWEIIDDAGTIESGDEEEVKGEWEKMLIGKYEMGKNVVPFTGRVRLVQVWGEI